MAKTETTVRGYVYTVTSPNGGTVTDAEGKLNKTVDAGDQVTVTAPSDSLTCDDDAAVICKANFKSPLLALRLLGQGETALPAGYTRLEFLQSKGAQYIDTGIVPSAAHGLKIDHELTNDLDTIPFGCRNDGSETRFYALRAPRMSTNGSYLGYGWGSWQPLSPNAEGRRLNSALNWLNSGLAEWQGATRPLSALPFTPTLSLFMFGANGAGVPYLLCYCRVWTAAISKGGSVMACFIPALAPDGTPCMFDTVTRQPFYNSGTGQFIAGVQRAAQMRTVLRKLPDRTGQDMGTLTLSIPAEAYTPEMQELLDSTEAQKNWELTIQARAAEVATYSLRRVRKVVWVRKVPTENGSYVDADGERWQTEWCSAIYSPRGNDPALHGYEPFDSVEAACEAWGLVPYVDPEAMDEAMGDNGTLEQGGTENTSPATNS